MNIKAHVTPFNDILFVAADECLCGIIILGLGFSEKQKQT
jgi:hypothetical protein